MMPRIDWTFSVVVIRLVGCRQLGLMSRSQGAWAGGQLGATICAFLGIIERVQIPCFYIYQHHGALLVAVACMKRHSYTS